MTGMILLGYAMSSLYLDLISYEYNNSWRILILYYVAIPMTVLNIPNFFISESPRFFANKNN